ncbi:MAG: DUF501 domain-containing protein [Thermoleophilia bacterium]
MERLLGREPAIGYKISLFCVYGWPALLRNDSFNSSGEPNPNVYYLVCPYLRRALSRLEDNGLIATLEARVAEDRDIADGVRKAQESHRREWIESASRKQDQIINSHIAPPNIAATASDGLLKCLHAHYAWYLAHPEYKLGRMIATELGQIWCIDERCRRIAAGLTDRVSAE